MQHKFYRNYGKRIIDIFFSCIMLLILWPVFLIIAILVKLDDQGPAIFVQERLTLNGRVFKMYKFRTMCVNAEKKGTGYILLKMIQE